MAQNELLADGEVRREDHEPGRGGLRKFAYEQIEDLLNSGALRPGQLITQRELVEMTGATLGSVRETVPRLEAEGLLVTVPQRGLMVPSLDVSFVRDAYEVRRMIEREAVPHVVERMEDSTVRGFIERLEALKAELESHDGNPPQELIDRIQREDWQTHSTFVRTMPNVLVNNIYRVTAIKIRMAVQSRIRVTGRNAARVLSEHAVILQKLAARDVEGTRRALDRHIGNSLEIALGGTVDPND